jgi:PAS domain S-box-containing protein
MVKSRILIVDDEVLVTRDLSAQLVELGYEPVEICTLGEEAVAVAERLRPDLVLMDIQLAGGMDGISAAQLIRDQLSLPVVFLTAFTEVETLNRAKLTEPFGYIIKPFDDRELLTVVEMALYKHQAEMKLRASEERYRLLFDHNPLPMWLYSTDTLSFLAVNNTAVQSYGYTPEEFLGMTIVQILPEDDRVRFLENLQQMRNERVSTGEWRHRRKDGSILHAETISRPLVFAAQQVRLVIAADITEKKQLQEQFLRAQRLESLGMLASGIAHDLNNMLAPILFTAPLLRSTLSTPRELRILDTLEKSAERGSGLVRQILAFAQGTTGAPRITQLKHIARDVLAILEASFPKDITLEQHIATNAWPVQANPTQIHQVLLNLCVNARDAMPHGGTLTVNISNRCLGPAEAGGIPGARAGDWLVLEVADTGTGIPPDVLPHIWDSFFTTKTSDKGTGLGLATVRGIVTGHLGFIQLETTVGHGTTFRIFLPASQEVEHKAVSDTPLPVPKGREELILVVDDDVSIREIVGEILSQQGYQVLSCADGVEAIVNYNRRSREIALVITDVDMPNLNGAILTSTLLKLKPDLPIVAISGLASIGVNSLNVAEAKLMATAFLTKPFTAVDLLAVVHRVLHPKPQP